MFYIVANADIAQQISTIFTYSANRNQFGLITCHGDHIYKHGYNIETQIYFLRIYYVD